MWLPCIVTSGLSVPFMLAPVSIRLALAIAFYAQSTFGITKWVEDQFLLQGDGEAEQDGGETHSEQCQLWKRSQCTPNRHFRSVQTRRYKPRSIGDLRLSARGWTGLRTSRVNVVSSVSSELHTTGHSHMAWGRDSLACTS